MIVAMLCVYLVLLFILVRLQIIRFNLFWKVSPFPVLLLLNIGRQAGPRHPQGVVATDSNHELHQSVLIDARAQR
jgi:hypothetical protein